MRVFKHWWFQTAIPHPRTDYENFHFLTFSPALVHFFPISNNHLFFLKSYAIFLKSFFFPSIALQFLQAHLYRSWFSDLSLAQLASWSCFNLSSLLLKCISKNHFWRTSLFCELRIWCKLTVTKKIRLKKKHKLAFPGKAIWKQKQPASCFKC